MTEAMIDPGATTTMTEVRHDDDPPTADDPPRSVEFEPWYQALHPRVVAALFVSTGDLDDAADAADEAMARALERWDRVRTMASPDGWVFQVAFNLVRRRGRRRALEHTVLRRSAAGRATTVPAPAGEAWDAVRQLPPRQRQVIALRFVADLPEAEIAALLGIARGTVSSTLVDARRALGPMLADPTPPDRRAAGAPSATTTAGAAGADPIGASAARTPDLHADADGAATDAERTAEATDVETM